MNNDEQLTCDECGRTETECQAQATNVVNPITQWIGYRGVMCDDCYYEKYASDEEDDDDEPEPEPEMSAAEWLKSQNLDQLQAYVDSFCKICKLQKEYDILVGCCACK